MCAHAQAYLIKLFLFTKPNTSEEKRSLVFMLQHPRDHGAAEANIQHLFTNNHVRKHCEKHSKENIYHTSTRTYNVPKHTYTISALREAGYQPEAIRTAQRTDPSTSSLYAYIIQREQPHTRKHFIRSLARKCFVEDNIIYKRGGIYGKQLLVPQCLRNELLASMHDAPWAGHFGLYHTLHRIAKNYWWPGMSTDVYNYVRSCLQCQSRTVPPHMRVHAPSVPDTIPKLFERVSVDVQGPFTRSKSGNMFLVTFMDIHSRWIEGFPVANIDGKTIANLLITEIILRYGPIRTLLSDRGSSFLNHIIWETCKLFRVNKIEIAAYHPESNAHVERVHRNYSDMLSKYINTKQNNWDEYFPFAQWAYRSSMHNELHASPYQLVFGRDPPEIADLSLLPPPPPRT